MFRSSRSEQISNLRDKYSTPKKYKKFYDTPTSLLSKLIHHAKDEYSLLKELSALIKKFAQERFSLIGNGNNFFITEIDSNVETESKNKTREKPEHAIAINMLLDMIEESSAYDVYQYLLTPYFKELVESNNKFSYFHKNELHEICQTFISKYKDYLKLNDTNLLINLLLDETIIDKITDMELGALFWFYNPTLVAEVIVNAYEKKDFHCQGVPIKECYLDYEKLCLFLKNDQKIISFVNKTRSLIKSSLLLPTDTVSPGKDILAEEGLTKYQLYQYDELTIYAIEQWLRTEYSKYIINKIKGIPNWDKKSEESPYYTYQISAALYMLLDPEDTHNNNYFRYKQFKIDLNFLLTSKPLDKPVIFFGMINIDGNHYIPYFILNNKGKMQVITIDSSPSTYPSYICKEKKLIDGKVKTHKKLKKIFQDLLPGCEYFDPNIVQMFRERDCGPNAATTIEDFLSTCASSNPLIKVLNGKMVLDVNQLTINFSPIGVNYYTGKYFYPMQLKEASFSNRNKWEMRLGNINNVVTMTVRSNSNLPMSILDEYDINQQLYHEYNYGALVESQEQQDVRDVNISSIRAMLFSNSEGNNLIDHLSKEMIKNLEMPGFTLMADFIKIHVKADQLIMLTSAHHHNLILLAQDVTRVVMKDKIFSILEDLFKKEVLSHLPLSHELDANEIVNIFLERTKNIYKFLSIYQQKTCKETLLHLADDAVKEKLLHFYSDIVETQFTQHGREYVSSMSETYLNKFDDYSYLILNKINEVIPLLSKHHALLRKGVEFLSAYFPDKLHQIINQKIKHIINNVVNETTEFIISHLQLNDNEISDSLQILDEKSGKSILESEDIYTLLNKNNNSSVLSLNEKYSLLSELVIYHVNLKIEKFIFQKIKLIIDQYINQFSNNNYLLEALLKKFTIKDFSDLLDENGKIISDKFDYNYFYRLFFPQDNLLVTEKDYQHFLTKFIIINAIEKTIEQIINKYLDNKFNDIADEILVTNQNKFIFSNIINKEGSFSSSVIYTMCYNVNSHTKDDSLFRQYIWDINGFKKGCGQRFNNWLMNRKIFPVVAQLESMQELNTNLFNSISILQRFIDTINKLNLNVKYNSLIEFISNSIFSFEEIYGEFKQLSLISDHLKEDFNHLDKVFTEKIKDFVAHLVFYSRYKLYDVAPGSISLLIRPILCAFLNMDMPFLITKEQAKIIDNNIKTRILSSNSLHIRSEINLLFYSALDKIPNTYALPLTRQILVNCIAYWLTCKAPHDVKHFSVWSDGNVNPKLITKLIYIVNNLPDDMNAELSESDIGRIKSLLDYNNNDQLDLCDSKDPLDHIKFALIMTKSCIDTTLTPLNYTELQGFLSNKEHDKKKLSEEQVQEKMKEEIKTLKKTNQQINLTLIRKKIINENDSLNFTEDLSNIQKNELKRNGIWKIDHIGLTQIEKFLIEIKNKHKEKDDFFLDYDDVKRLTLELKLRWTRLCSKHSNNMDEAASCYFQFPERNDKVYIAVAEILAKFHRQQGNIVYSYELLVPGYYRFPQANQLKQQTFPESICQNLGIKQEESHVDCIPISHLLITRSGYFFDINWIVHAYLEEGTLINPYTKNVFSDSELEDISTHPLAQEIFLLMKKLVSTNVTAQAIELLVEYLNGAIFTNGFTNSYDENQNKLAFQAYTQFNLKLKRLPRGERDALLNETIPGYSDTVKEIFKKSEVKTKDELKKNSADPLCLTLQGVFFARVVIAYKGDNHGLKNQELVKRAREKSISARKFNQSNSSKVNQFSHQEVYLFDQLAERQERKSFINWIGKSS